MIAVLSLALVAGVLIGCIGIGGVILVPCLSMAGIDVHEAIAASMASFIFSGAIGQFLYTRGGSIDAAASAWLGAGAVPGAFAGALLASALGGNVLLAMVGAAVIFAGARSLWRARGSVEAAPPPAPSLLVPVGAVVGFGSAMTGTGGPLMLVPLLMWLGLPVRAAVGLGQAIQIPIAGFATAGYLWTGHFGLELALLLSIGVAFGCAVGAKLAHAAPTILLTRLVAVVLLVVGALLVLRSGAALR